MKEFNIYFDDLKPEIQQALLDFYGVESAADLNMDYNYCNPLCTIELEDDNYDRAKVEEDYDLEDGELDDVSIREAEKMLGLEEGELDQYIIEEDEDERPWDSSKHFE